MRANNFVTIDQAEWGHRTQGEIDPVTLIDAVHQEIDQLANQRQYEISAHKQQANDNPGYERIWIDFPVRPTLFDQFFNGRSGYRAQHYASPQNGEAFNRLLLETIAPSLLEISRKEFTPEFFRQSLLGAYTKFCFPKTLTDQANNPFLARLRESIAVPKWRKYWEPKAPPRKGLLAPLQDPEGECSILINGTFIDPKTGDEWEQKPFRSQQLHDEGWT
jgi:hypothetical protein